MESFRGQMILAREYKTVMPLLARRLDRALRDILSNIIPISGVRVKECLLCGGRVDTEGRCTEGRWVRLRINGRYQDTRCQAVWK